MIAALGRLLPVHPSVLRHHGVLGMNRRNARYILPFNPRHFYPRVDDKLATKEICREHGIPTPRTFAVIRRHGDLARLEDLVSGYRQFVFKPACGSGGRGVVVIEAHDAAGFRTAGRETMSLVELRHHVSTTLSGLHSLGGQVDRAIMEQRIVRHPAFDSLAVRGTPDVRVVLYRRVPVMAMIRLPTEASRGRANLHQGAVGAGIDLCTGTTTSGVWQDRCVARHPDTGVSIVGFRVPYWRSLLTAAMQLADALGLDYVGTDLVVDTRAGAVVLEANARPGLAIQVANRLGLLPRLEYVAAQNRADMPIDRRWELLARLPS